MPRGLIISTGEDAPQGHSLRSRQLILEVTPSAIKADVLTLCQQDARNGVYATAMSGFLYYYAKQYEANLALWRESVEEYREAATGTGRRTSEIVTNLRLAWDTFLKFACEVEAITFADFLQLQGRGVRALTQVGALQVEQHSANDPVDRFLALIAAALSSGRAHVAALNGGPPDNAEAWGWRRSSSDYPHTVQGGGLQPQRERIGYLIGDNLYLIPDAALIIAKKLGEESGDGIPLSGKTLHKRLYERSLLLSTDGTRRTLTIRLQIAGMRQEVLHLPITAVLPPISDQSDHTESPLPLSTPLESSNSAISEQNGQIGQIPPTQASPESPMVPPSSARASGEREDFVIE